VALRDVQTQANLLEAVVEMNTRQTNVERRADNIEDSLRCLQVRVRIRLLLSRETPPQAILPEMGGYALALVSAIAPSLSLDHICGAVSLLDFATSTFLSDSSVVH